MPGLPYPDPRTRSKRPLRALSRHESFTPATIITPLIAQGLRIIALSTCKEWLLDRGFGSPWVLSRTLSLVGLVVTVWWLISRQPAPSPNWGSLAVASAALLIQYWTLYAALGRLPITIVLVFTHASTSWISSLLSSASPHKSAYVLSALSLSALSSAYTATSFDPNPSLRSVFPAYAFLILHAIAALICQRSLEVLTVGVRSHLSAKAMAFAAAGSISFLAALFTQIMPDSTPPVLPLGSLLPIPLLAASILYPPKFPSTSPTSHPPLGSTIPIILSFPLDIIISTMFGVIAFRKWPGIFPLFVAGILYTALCAPVTKASELQSAMTAKQLHTYLDTVLSNPESRNISYFLALNLAYMGIQITYGVWTNSLGLISDAIHMFFDCIAIAMGLLASVMATWPPDERFTYGYGRIETLSGFANGIFLILISIFIVFEAIQRILDPPEMNTSQLLLVSTMGLGVNLFGMFAMGGHHHHHHGGHGHSHGKGNGHSHGHCRDHDHDHGHNHGHENGHHHRNHSHHDHPPLYPHADHDQHGHGPPPLHGHGGENIPNQTRTHNVSNEPGDEEQHPDIQSPIVINDHDALLSHASPSRSHVHSHSFSHLSLALFDAQSSLPDATESPVTPSYSFTEDAHVAKHHPENVHSHHGHADHGHSHNMRGVFLHVMADTLGSVGVIVSTLLIQLYGWTGFDPIASLFIATLIVASVVPLVIDCGRVLSLDLGGQEDVLLHIHGVEAYAHPRFWPRDAETLVGSITIHVARSPHDKSQLRVPLADVVRDVDRVLRRGIPMLTELSIQVEG
ncbi:hypothetical protein BS47DRAFT_1482806 [Hydnum rufescens UP504]|uniref:Cation efflux protein transmembrane domain-containing protein n=1 Tax=Hydnum rufescens UP504 TaxID=1448309 RepID=A0A9P6B6C3_9AGAM|nr:hypothetical protein BS47DRAFT_1482806 [Hydnum rufescens UP504]